ncbi:anti-sigma factor [Bradyrhizobium sp. ARR65]|uniref:anti-sigma factor n=1 Tax=Bradyrhizobium sp. ARR65 TaxID=1040989 RepID=UPI0004654767|nr:anti-sigma factor [Bradyrhizobium sp. ARR65]
MPYSEDHIALAAEYALGTLEPDERVQVETMMAVDKDFAALVEAWRLRLGALNQMVGLVEPRPVVWENIRNAIRHAEPQAPLILPEAPQVQPAPAEPAAEAGALAPQASGTPPAATVAPAADDSNVIRLARQARRWRGIASAVAAIAAALVALLCLQLFAPSLLPDALRPPPQTKVVEAKLPAAAPRAAAQYVALLQGQGGGPAFILTVDGATRNFTVRKVGAGDVEAGKSYELWLISDKLDRPRSLGVIGSDEFTTRPLPSSYDADVINSATYAVTVEQAGGSPDGTPHSDPVYSGRLIETVPAGAAAEGQSQKR